ncbi:hypothetical protein RFN28_18425 [Mesorhizobium sp. VK24D]|uniref:Transposase n=1 Tax=Mesorhizobium album TaxID=3072314 RepID=A0ABU4Y0E9_9HYPH|nr:hypothetical protein [Mesorhizobium sp. VK24D]MDX8480424.1 hypothetical protein [Mesorhizobium sp. VK24D]
MARPVLAEQAGRRSALAALAALDSFERAIVERDNRLVVETRRLKCLAILDGIIGG